MNLLAVAVADYVGFILLIALIFSSRIRRSMPRDEFKIYTVIAFMTAIACVIDFITFFCDGKPGKIYRFINILGNTYCFLSNPLFALSWCIFTELKLYGSRARIKRRYRYVAIPAMILVLATLVNIFYPIIYYLDEYNTYHRLPLSYIFYLVEAGYFTYSFVVLKRYENKYDRVRFFPMLLMIGPIILGCFLQAAFYGVSLIFVSLAVGITCIYMSMQNEFSYLDTLTGMYNRAYLDYVLERYSKSSTRGLGGIMIDVDYFKAINDTYGHSVGDEALIDVSRVILFGKPDDAIAIRFAGDEFIILCKNCTKELLQKTMNNIREEVKVFNENEDRQYKLSLSLGYALFDYEKDDIDSFFKHMDDRMYEEKTKKHAER